MMLVLKALLLFVSGWVVVIGFAISLGGGDPNVYWYMCVPSYFLTIFAAWLLHIGSSRPPQSNSSVAVKRGTVSPSSRLRVALVLHGPKLLEALVEGGVASVRRVAPNSAP
jgi:hypothetical protein